MKNQKPKINFRPSESDTHQSFVRNTGRRAGSVSDTRRKLVYERDGFKCVKCGSEDDLTIDHIFPVSKGGTNEIDNLQTMCESCNVKKGDKIE